MRYQARRAADSVVLNIAEGTSRAGTEPSYHWRVSSGSAAEATAALDLIQIPQGPEIQQKLRRVAAMLRKLR